VVRKEEVTRGEVVYSMSGGRKHWLCISGRISFRKEKVCPQLGESNVACIGISAENYFFSGKM
jgi:hypothetical protein